ncbi:MAG: DUF4388 domain-containing protein [Candidatus Aminicenantia bacterium]
MVRSGNLRESLFPTVMLKLYRSLEKGELKISREDKEIKVFVDNGFILHATSSDINDRIEGILLKDGKISNDILAEIENSKGKSPIRILLEKGSVNPRELKNLFYFQTINCVYQVFDWEEGDFLFTPDNIKQILFPLKITIIETVIEGIRAMKNEAIFGKKILSNDIINLKTEELKYSFEPHEIHVIGLIDGSKSVSQICSESILPEKETLRVLYLLYTLGLIDKKVEKKPSIPPQADLIKIVDKYNQCFSFIYRSLYKEIGPIAENIFEKYISDVKENLSEDFKSVSLKKDGSLNLDQILSNFNLRLEELVQRLDEFLIAMIYAVKRTLGQKYESYVVKTINELRK